MRIPETPEPILLGSLWNIITENYLIIIFVNVAVEV